MSEIQTPETDEVLRRNAASDQTPQEDYEILADHAANLEYRLAERTEQRDKLADACKKLMKVVGPPNATIEQCWAGVDEIDEAYIAGEQALSAVKGVQQ